VKGAQSRLMQLVDDKDTAVRVTARFGLHRIGIYTYSHDLELLARDPEPRVRGTTAMVLGMIGDTSGAALLKHLRKDPVAAVRQQAAVSLWKLGDPQGEKDLVGWAISSYEDDEMIALLGLADKRDRHVIQHIRTHLTDEAPEVSLVAARAMGMLGSDEGLGVVHEHIASQDPRERLLAALALADIGRSDSQGSLRTLAADPQADVRIAASQAILQLKPHFVDESKRG
jgi:HEAT repeat protein